MHNFFTQQENRRENVFIIEGGDVNHIKNVLRMKEGEKLLVSCDGQSHLCAIKAIFESSVECEILEENYIDSSLNIKLYLFQGLPKSDKMEFIIQKAVELGAEGIYGVEMENCVVKLDSKKKASKLTRWQEIAKSAAKQCKRSFIPEVYPILSYDEAIKEASKLDVFLVPFESKNGMKDTKEALLKIKKGSSVGILIGAEGGFSESEIKKAEAAGANIISLGKRILRCETAAVASLCMCMLYAETELCDD
ncbi:MAG: 16S rRNA (uracil(1498)-N(3))-methyltransferase [Oscillospiraceae bacterium]|nr:16S rRNA (uracil(1498)-N(3))-methyltransferase [Oscillospiraceae bacterium]